MKTAAFLLIAWPCAAHVVSMSTGEARLNGARLDYELRMPLYEVAHIANPESQLFGAIRFSGAGGAARLLEHGCRTEGGNYVCAGLYLFDRETEAFNVECRFASITVPNHVHLLRATRGDTPDQAAFDASFTSAAIRFRPPTVFESAMRDVSAGFWRGIAGVAQILFLTALLVAARSRRELLVLAAMLLAGEAVAVAAGLSSRLAVSPRFVEAAAALAVAYLAVEILLLPRAGQRWLVVGVLGILHGLYFDMLLSAGDYARPSFLAGAFAAQLVVIGLLAAVRLGLSALPLARHAWLRKAMPSLLLVAGVAWFVLRLWS